MIVETAAEADHAALAELFCAYQPLLLRYLRGRAADVATDVASEVWIAVARNLHRFVGDERGFRRWLFVVARARLVEVDRKRARHRAAPTALRAIELSNRVVEDMSAQDAVDAIVEGLSPDEADVVLLRMVAGFDVTDVATIMGRTPSSVRVLSHRALRSLRARLSEWELAE